MKKWIRHIVFVVFITPLIWGQKEIAVDAAGNAVEIHTHRANRQSTVALTKVGALGWGPNHAIAAKDSFLFVGNGKVFQVYSTTPNNPPALISEIYLPFEDLEPILDISIRNGYAYVACHQVYIIDINDIQSPELLYRITFPFCKVNQVITTGNHVILGSEPGIFYAMNDSNIDQLKFSGLIDTRISFSKYSMYKDYIYIIWGSVFTHIYKCSNVDSILPIDVLTVPGTEASMLIKDNNLIFATRSTLNPVQLIVYSLANPVKPLLISQSSLPVQPFEPASISISGDVGVMCDNVNGNMVVFNALNVHAPVWMQTISSSQFSPTKSVRLSDRLYTAAVCGLWTHRLIHDTLSEVSMMYSGGISGRSVSQNDYSYVASANVGLVVYNTATIASPKRIAVVPVPGGCGPVVLEGNTIVMGVHPTSDRDTTEGLYVIDVTNPENPIINDRVQNIISDRLNSAFVSVKVFQNMLFVLTSNNIDNQPISTIDTVIRIYDLSDLNDLRLMTTYSIPPYDPVDFTVIDSLMYLSLGEGGLRLLQYSVDSVWEIGRSSAPSYGITRFGEKIVVAGDSMRFFNKGSCLPYRTQISNLYAYGMVLVFHNEHVYASSAHSLVVYDTTGKMIDSTWLRTQISGISVTQKKLILSNDRFGIVTFSIDDDIRGIDRSESVHHPKSMLLYQNYPNPFNGVTTFKVQILKSGPLRINVYNIEGRWLRTIFSGNADMGERNFVFDANGFNSGIYFVHIESSFDKSLLKTLYIK